MNGYVLGVHAQQDLTDLWEYIAEDNLEAADRLIDRLFAAFEKIAQMPDTGHEPEDLTQLPVLF